MTALKRGPVELVEVLLSGKRASRSRRRAVL